MIAQGNLAACLQSVAGEVCPDGFRLIGCRCQMRLKLPQSLNKVTKWISLAVSSPASQDKLLAAGVSERISIKRHAPRHQIFWGQVGFFYAHRERIQVANERL